MMNRLKLATKILSGRPLLGSAVDGALLLNDPQEADGDYATSPPLDLVLGGHVESGPPIKVLQTEQFRVCVFRAKPCEDCVDCGAPTSWLTLELEGEGTWLHLVTMHESRLTVMLSVLGQAADFLRANREDKPAARRQ